MKFIFVGRIYTVYLLHQSTIILTSMQLVSLKFALTEHLSNIENELHNPDEILLITGFLKKLLNIVPMDAPIDMQMDFDTLYKNHVQSIQKESEIKGHVFLMEDVTEWVMKQVRAESMPTSIANDLVSVISGLPTQGTPSKLYILCDDVKLILKPYLYRILSAEVNSTLFEQ